MKKLELKNVLWKEGKYYVAQCLNVDVSSFGRTKPEAIKNIKEALELYFEDMKFPKIKKVGNPVIISEELQYA
ncbi:MAG: type II toxin-antitoxin system HicB family antitoxin [Candidatus Paceibacter sp.]|nr:type II toxin-antitoxin system HicB family antitoxin [Candidatus Paceibacter sp.]